MKKIYLLGIILILITNFSIVGCSNMDKGNLNKSNLPTSAVSLSYNQIGNNVHIFDWYVENISQDVGQTLTFEEGSITNFEIRNIQSNKVYRNDNYQILNYKLINKKDTDINNYENYTVILNSGERYHKTIVIQSLEEGRYSAKFWALSEEGTNPSMTINFEVKANK